MRCEEFRNRIFDRDKESEAHTLICPSCAKLQQTVEAEAHLLSQAKAPLPPKDLWMRIQAQMNAPHSHRTSGTGWLLAAAASLLAAIALLVVSRTPEQSAPETVQKPRAKPEPRLQLTIVEAPPEASRAFSGMVPSYDEVDPNAAVMSALTGSDRRR